MYAYTCKIWYLGVTTTFSRAISLGPIACLHNRTGKTKCHNHYMRRFCVHLVYVVFERITRYITVIYIQKFSGY